MVGLMRIKIFDWLKILVVVGSVVFLIALGVTGTDLGVAPQMIEAGYED